KPFWDSFEEIDVAAYAEALATIFRFLSEEESIPLFLDCLEPERSGAVKICAIKAATTLSSEAPRLPWQQPSENLQTAIAPRLRGIFQMSSIRRSEYESDGTIRRAASRTKAKQFTSETLADKDLMLILTLWRATPYYYVTSVESMSQSQPESWKAMSVRIRDSDTDTAVKISAESSFQHFTDIFFRMHPNGPYYAMVEACMKESLLADIADVHLKEVAAD
ncbi:hypothetical protein AZE42_08827, partial [Rhizopogon vesiculosus]